MNSNPHSRRNFLKLAAAAGAATYLLGERRMTGVAFPDLFKQGAIAGIAAGQPIIASEIGNVTQTNFEAFYNFPINDNIRITPTIQVVTNAGNQDANGTIVTGTIRTVFLF